MRIQVDQSGKIEQTNKTTVVAYANGGVKSVVISGIEKQKLLQTMRAAAYPKKVYRYKIFAALVFFLIKQDIQKTDDVVIDCEYVGHEGIIKDVLIGLLRKNRRPVPSVRFAHIGKQSPAHKAALDVYRKKVKPDLRVMAEQVFQLFFTK